MPETITGKLKKIIWRSLENDFTIAAFINTSNSTEFIVTGDIFKPAKDLTYSLEGKWKEHAKYGQQFRISSYCIQEPVDESSITAYLEKYIAGIGPVMAGTLVDLYGKHTLKLLKKAPERVSNEVKGITYAKALKISEQLQEGDKQQEILIKLEGIFSKVKGIPHNLAKNIISLYGLSAYEVIKNNPYALVDMSRIGFLTADKIAMSMGVKPDDPGRIKYGMLYIIKQIIQETGDIWLEPSVVGDNLSRLIKNLDSVLFINIFKKLIKEKILTEHKEYITIAQFAKDEDCVVDCVVRFLS